MKYYRFRDKRVLDITNEEDLDAIVKGLLEDMLVYPSRVYYGAMYNRLKTDITNGDIEVNVIQDGGEYCAEHVNKRHYIMVPDDYVKNVIERHCGLYVPCHLYHT